MTGSVSPYGPHRGRMRGLTRIVMEFDDGTKYAIEGEELKTFAEYVNYGIDMLFVHGADMDRWNKLIRKIYGRPISTDGTVVE